MSSQIYIKSVLWPHNDSPFGTKSAYDRRNNFEVQICAMIAYGLYEECSNIIATIFITLFIHTLRQNIFVSFTIKRTLGSCLCYSGRSMLSVDNLQPNYLSFTHKSLLDPSKWYMTC